jgi:hypothetical protein
MGIRLAGLSTLPPRFGVAGPTVGSRVACGCGTDEFFCAATTLHRARTPTVRTAGIRSAGVMAILL